MKYNIEAEKRLLGCMILDNEIIDLINGKLNEYDFYSPETRKLYKTIMELHNDSKVVEQLILLEYGHTIEFITDVLKDIGSAQIFNRYLSIVLDNSLRRRILKATHQIQKIANEDTHHTNLSELKSDCLELLDIKIDDDPGDGELKTSDIVKLFEIIEERSKMNGKELSRKNKYGFPWLDTATAGTHKGEVTVLAARPGTGKTAFALNIALSKIIAGSNVKIFSLEMTKESLLERMIINFAKINGLKLRAGKQSDDDYVKILKAAEEIKQTGLSIDDKTYKFEEIRASCRRAKNKDKLDYVIIDYLQLIESNFKANSTNDKIEYISRKIKLLAKEMDVPILLLSQLNRGLEARQDKTPQLSDLRSSGAIEQDADNIFFLNVLPQEDYRESNSTIVDIILTIAKQRSGISNKNNLMKFITIHQRFAESYDGE